MSEAETIQRCRGRPRSDVVRTQWCHFRLTDDEKRELRNVALLNGKSMTEFVRDAVAEAVADCTETHVIASSLDLRNVALSNE